MSEAKLRMGFIGFGSHVVKNILNKFDAGAPREIGAIYVRDPAKYTAAHGEWAAAFTGDLDGMLADPGFQVVYVATPIATHAAFVRAALRAGKHVICEKPLTDWHATSVELSTLAEAKGLMLAEVAMYQYHPQFRTLKEEVTRRVAAGERVIGARTRFSIPELPPEDIRYSKELAGGALFDVGFYPLSASLALFGVPQATFATGYMDPALEVDLSGNALLDYGGFGCHCLWAIGSSYSNEIEVSLSKSTLTVPRAFSKPADLATKIAVAGPSGQPEDPISVPADDQFACMFSAYEAALAKGDPAEFVAMSAASLERAALFEEMRAQVMD